MVDATADELHVNMDSSGVVSIDTTGKGNEHAYVLLQGSKAVITGAGCNNINYLGSAVDGSIRLTPPVTDSDLFARVHLSCVNNTSGNATLYGTASFDKSGGNIPVGKYTATFTVTAVYGD